MAIDASDKLYIYNQALLILESRQLSSVSEDRESRRVLDQAWGSSDERVTNALEMADWNFATRVSKLTYDPNLETEFGHRYVFSKPTDFVRLTSISANPTMVPVMRGAYDYRDESGYWLSDFDTLYVKYVSDHTDYGFSSGSWPEAFKQYIAGKLAFMACGRLTKSTKLTQKAKFIADESLKHATSRDAMDEGTKTQPPFSWVRARTGYRGWYNDDR